MIFGFIRLFLIGIFYLNSNEIALSSAKDINLESTQDSYQNRSENSNSGWSVGVFLGMSGNSMGLGVEGSAQFGKGKSNTDTITQSNTYLNAKEVNIESQNDNPLDTGKAVAENLWQGAKDCVSQPIDCLVDVVDGIFEGPNGGRVIHTGQYDPITKNAIYQRLDKDGSLQNSYWTISEDNKQIKHNKPEYLPNSRESNVSWQKSESDVAKLLGNSYSSQVSYLNGKEVPHGTHGSVRLDFSNKSDVAIEVKNYDIHSNRASLVSVIAKQVMERKKHLPEGMQQNIYIDLRGQNSTAVDKLDIKNKINKQSNGVINTNNIHFLEDEK